MFAPSARVLPSPALLAFPIVASTLPCQGRPRGSTWTGQGTRLLSLSAGEQVGSPLIKHNLNPMGIDIYAQWKGQTEKEKEAQLTGFSVEHGHVGYLREAYHGAPFATFYLVAEAVDSPSGQAKIPAKMLRERLPETIRLAKERERVVYDRKGEIPDDDPVIQSFANFVALCERKEQETGEPVTIIASY